MDAEIHQAWVSQFVASGFGLPIAHENLHYTPEAGESYFEIRVLANDVTPASLSDSDESDGVFRVILRSPQGAGAAGPKLTLGEVANAFPIGARLNYGNTRIVVTGRQQQPGAPEGGWYVVILDFQYRAFSKRTGL